MVMPVLAVAATEFSDYSVMLVGVAIGGYGLTQAALQIPMGMLSDKWGRKPVILLGLSVFALGSIIAAMADSMMWLIAGRTPADQQSRNSIFSGNHGWHWQPFA